MKAGPNSAIMTSSASLLFLHTPTSLETNHCWFVNGSHPNVPQVYTAARTGGKQTWDCQTSTAVTERHQWRGITCPNDRNTKKKKRFIAVFSVDLWSNLLKIDVWKSPKYGRERCHFVSRSLCLWRREHDRHVWRKITSRANLFYFSVVKSEPAWLHPEEINFEAKKKKKSTSVA